MAKNIKLPTGDKSLREENFETLKKILGSEEAAKKATSQFMPNEVGAEFVLDENMLTANSARLFNNMNISQCIGEKFRVTKTMNIYKADGKWSTIEPKAKDLEQTATVPTEVEHISDVKVAA